MRRWPRAGNAVWAVGMKAARRAGAGRGPALRGAVERQARAAPVDRVRRARGSHGRPRLGNGAGGGGRVQGRRGWRSARRDRAVPEAEPSRERQGRQPHLAPAVGGRVGAPGRPKRVVRGRRAGTGLGAYPGGRGTGALQGTEGGGGRVEHQGRGFDQRRVLREGGGDAGPGCAVERAALAGGARRRHGPGHWPREPSCVVQDHGGHGERGGAVARASRLAVGGARRDQQAGGRATRSQLRRGREPQDIRRSGGEGAAGGWRQGRRDYRHDLRRSGVDGVGAAQWRWRLGACEQGRFGRGWR